MVHHLGDSRIFNQLDAYDSWVTQQSVTSRLAKNEWLELVEASKMLKKEFGWWLTSEKYLKVSWDHEIPNVWKVKKFHGSKPHRTFWIRPKPLPERVKNSPLGKRLFVVDAGMLLVHQVLDLYHV